jgi:hypothetical protein
MKRSAFRKTYHRLTLVGHCRPTKGHDLVIFCLLLKLPLPSGLLGSFKILEALLQLHEK